ncbi:MAG: hypothetical protein KKA07_15760 [Bacteroidetes bacterium]|nr:hypothetical protein [Bacteroidota bacterium]MBU1720520.1 hypothetical protein [Bacteroidota bacterium]
MRYILILLLCAMQCASIQAQQQDSTISDTAMVTIIATGAKTTFVGQISWEDDREVCINTLEGEKVIIPKYSITSRETMTHKEYFASLRKQLRNNQIITLPGLSTLKRGQSTLDILELSSVHYEYGTTDKLSLGVTDIGIFAGIFGSLKYRVKISEGANLLCIARVGTSVLNLVGAITGDAFPFFAYPGVYVSAGRNSTFITAGGGVMVWGPQLPVAVLNVGGQVRLNNSIVLCVESYGVRIDDDQWGGALMPGIKWISKKWHLEIGIPVAVEIWNAEISPFAAFPLVGVGFNVK